jgi:hypothetical protein
MAFTQIDLSSVETAIIALQTGSRVVEVQIERAGKMVRYSESQLPALMSLRSAIQMELGMIPARTYARQTSDYGTRR